MVQRSQRSNSKTAIGQELGRLRFWMLLAASLLFLFISTVWDAYEIQCGTVNKHATAQAVEGSGSSSNGQHAEETVLPLFTPRPYIEFLRELGFGCFIALVLIVFVERSAREEQAHSAEEQRATISENVFKAVFALHTPAPIVNAACDQIFKARVVRVHHKNDYHLRELEHESIGGDRDILQRFLKVDITTDYMLRNVSDQEIEIPIRLGFPVPPLPNFSNLVKVRAISIGGQQLTPEQITEGDRAADEPPERIRYLWRRKVGPADIIHVVANYTLIKERSDNEVWQTLYPGLGMELTVNIDVEGLEFGVHPLHEKTPRKLSGVGGETGIHRWLLDVPVLPHQGMVLWWRPTEKSDGVNTQKGIISQSAVGGSSTM